MQGNVTGAALGYEVSLTIHANRQSIQRFMLLKSIVTR